MYQYVDKYGANVDGYSPIYNTDEWSPGGDVYAGGKLLYAFSELYIHAARKRTSISVLDIDFPVSEFNVIVNEMNNVIMFAGKTGLLIWAVTLAGILAGGALLVYSTSALAQ